MGGLSKPPSLDPLAHPWLPEPPVQIALSGAFLSPITWSSSLLDRKCLLVSTLCSSCCLLPASERVPVGLQRSSH